MIGDYYGVKIYNIWVEYNTVTCLNPVLMLNNCLSKLCYFYFILYILYRIYIYVNTVDFNMLPLLDTE